MASRRNRRVVEIVYLTQDDELAVIRSRPLQWSTAKRLMNLCNGPASDSFGATSMSLRRANVKPPPDGYRLVRRLDGTEQVLVIEDDDVKTK